MHISKPDDCIETTMKVSAHELAKLSFDGLDSIAILLFRDVIGWENRYKRPNYQIVSDSKIQIATLLLSETRGLVFDGLVFKLLLYYVHFFTTPASGDDGTANFLPKMVPNKVTSEAGFEGCFAKLWVFEKNLWDVRGSRAWNVGFSCHSRFFSKSHRVELGMCRINRVSNQLLFLGSLSSFNF